MSILWLLLVWILCWCPQTRGQCIDGDSTQIHESDGDIIPPERICVVRMTQGRDRLRLHFNWTGARMCSPLASEQFQYIVHYGKEGTGRSVETTDKLEFSIDGVTNDDMYYFQVAAVATSSNKASTFTQCFNVTVGILPSVETPKCREVMYECPNQNLSTTTVSDKHFPTTTIQPVSTLGSTATTTPQTDAPVSTLGSTATTTPQTDAPLEHNTPNALNMTQSDNFTEASAENSTTNSRPVLQETTENVLVVVIPVVILGSMFLIVLLSGLILFSFLVRRSRRKRAFMIKPTKQAHGSGQTISAYNPIIIDSQDSERRYAFTSEDKFNHNTIRRMSMRSSVFENRTRMMLAKPQITSVSNEMHVIVGQQVTLRLSFSGTPQPTVVWTFKGRPLGDDTSVELSADGSLVIVCVEQRHTGRYGIEISNTVGRTKGHINLIVHQSRDEAHNRDENILESAHIKTNAVKREEFGEYVARMHALNNKGFINQFQALETCEDGKFFLVGRTGCNQQLNRFRNITAYDHNRIVLRSMQGTQNEYINASYIDGHSRTKKYIATQGPLLETVVDFWHMVWQEKVPTIAMVTNTIERCTKKCEVYWPDMLQEEKEVGPFKITLTAQQVFADYTVRYMELERLGEDDPPWKIIQYHYTSWPDHGVPEYAGPILSFLKHIKVKHTQDKGPLLVHCSAGIGRTGTLIAIDMILTQASTEGIIDVPAVVTKMREQRMKMVQTTDQYMLIHDAVLEFLICGNTRVVASNFSTAVDHLNRRDKQTGKSGYETQFEVLDQVSPKPDEVMCAAAMQNQRKNRSDKYLPPDNWRVFLLREIPDYINASFVNGYRERKGFIIAQSPTTDTIREFWKMIFDRKCNIVVMLADMQEEGASVCAQYWPPRVNSCRHFKEFTVTTESEETKNGFTERVISVVDTKSGDKHKVTQYQVGHWTAEGLNSYQGTVIEVIDKMSVVQRRTGNMPVVVHGCNTVNRSCIFCALVNAIEFCKMESVVDIFEVVKAIRIQKPGAIQTVEQYKFIYDLMLYFLDEFSDYCNFK